MDQGAVQYQVGSSTGDQGSMQGKGDSYFTSYASVEVAQAGGGAAGVRKLENQPHLKGLENDFHGDLAVPGDGLGKPTMVKALLDSGRDTEGVSEQEKTD